jgi:hypothetical protein
VIVHRLLQATLDGPEAVNDFPINNKQSNRFAKHATRRKKVPQKAQE